MSVPIVAFGHRKQVGKDLATKLLGHHCELNNIHVAQKKFAYELKKVCFDLYEWDGMPNSKEWELNPECRNRVLPNIGKTPRQLLIETGNKMRSIYPNIWVDLLMNKPFIGSLMIISDLRFPNEMKSVHDCGGICIKIRRPSIKNTDDEADVALAGYQPWDAIIFNDGTELDLCEKIIKICNPLIGIKG